MSEEEQKLDFKGFADDIISLGLNAVNFDGAEIADIAASHGLLKEEPTQVPCDENCACLDFCNRGEVVSCYRKQYKRDKTG